MMTFSVTGHGWKLSISVVIGASRMNKKWIILLLVFALVFSTVQSAVAATTWTLNIHNNTNDVVKLTLTGPKKYSLTLQPGKVYKEVLEGTYKYSYNACGKKFTGSVTVKNSATWLRIKNCRGPFSSALWWTDAKFVVISRSSVKVMLKLVGPRKYNLRVDRGRYPFSWLLTGTYTYSYTACGVEHAGSILLQENVASQLKLIGKS